jgi:di/tricarboxylate transporter
MGILLLTIFLFAFEVVGVDVAAVTVMVILGLLSSFSDLLGLAQPLVPTNELFRGFPSNAVMSIIAVMIIGAGLDKTGLMTKVAATILKVAGQTEVRIIPAISGTVGFISSFMQNVGAAALFLPVVSRISARTGLPMSRLLMPMGFCAILGGTITMIGSSPLILLNDLILTSNKALPPEQQMETWSLFSVTPIGIALLVAGIAYFVIAGHFVLPGGKHDDITQGTNAMQYFQDLYGLNYGLFEVVVPAGTPLIGKMLDKVEPEWRVRVIAAQHSSEELRVGPGSLARDTGVQAGMVLGILAAPDRMAAFVSDNHLELCNDLKTFAEPLAVTKAGIAEVVIPPGSNLIGKSARDVWMRKTYGIAMVALHRGGETLREGDGIRNLPLQAGDALIVHTTWAALAHLERDKNFVVLTTEYPHEELRPHKVTPALVFFGIALFMVLFTDVRLSIALMTGAIGMILSGVLKIEEAYHAVSWKSVFLLASLIPLGLAVEASGTAAWIAEQTLSLLGGVPTWVLQLAIAALATFFTLVMSNVGATVLLVPLAVNIAIGAGANPAVFALTVALATSNSFFLPTHQVNALIMGPAGYRVADFMRAGGIMTVLFLVVVMLMLNLIY